jgi:hypothetical protein
MTIRKIFEQRLYENGLFQDQAAEVVRRAEEAEGNEAMRGRWDDDESGYPPQLIPVVWLSVKAAALAWIDENCPGAWFRPLFEEKAEGGEAKQSAA